MKKWQTICVFISVLWVTIPSWAIDVLLAQAPTSDLALTLKAIKSSRKNLLVNVYELTSPSIKDAIIDKIKQGVQVEVLMEGQPVAGRSLVAKQFQNEIVEAMKASKAKHHFYLMGSSERRTRRYVYNHAKYQVIDGQYLVIGSENASPTGHPVSGEKGNRGWEVGIQDALLAKQMEQVFRADTAMKNSDVLDLLTSAAPFEIFNEEPLEVIEQEQREPVAAYATAAELVLSPDNSYAGLLQLIRGAKKTIDIQLLSFSPKWGEEPESPLINALQEASKRGVRIRVLLNDESVFDKGSKAGKRKNEITAEKLNKMGKNVTAKIANLGAMGVEYIHNKGMLVDGSKTLISSINWNQNSIERNREAAVVLTGKEVFEHYETMFEADWNAR